MRDIKKPLLTHLQEIKRRLLFGLVFFLVCFVGGLFLTESLYQFFIHPLQISSFSPESLLLTNLTSGFSLSIRFGFIFAFVCSFPFWLFQIWRFVLPALKKKERLPFMLFLSVAPFLFFIGAGFAYFVITPLAWDYLLSFYDLFAQGNLPAKLTPRVEDYINLMLSFLMTFGLAFELPAILILLMKLKILSPQVLIRSRRYVIIAIFTAAAILTPPDVLSQILLAVPLILLYEMAIFFGRKM
ncbi:MAG: twin-arginine translocase subunit TatC [Alphaproteobacteria bacterium]|nr:twin-arginine translocase subunit TatC [Alphaproteobacteria bacterium]